MIALSQSRCLLQSIAGNLETRRSVLRREVRESTPDKARTKFSEADLREMAALYASGRSPQSIAEEFGSSRETVRRRLKELGVDGRQPKFSEQDCLAMAALYESGLTQMEVASQWGCTVYRVTKILAKYGVKRETPHQKRKFSDEECRRMTDLYQTGKTQSELAEMFGCSQTTVRNVLIQSGVTLRRNHRVSGEDCLRMAALYQSGQTIKEAAHTFGCSPSLVTSILKAHGVEIVPRRNEEHRHSGDALNRMAEMRQNGHTLKAIAGEFGYGISFVHKLLKKANIQKQDLR